MGLFKCLASCFLFYAALAAAAPYDELKQHALYLMQQNQFENSIEKYKEYAAHTGRHDFEILRQMGLIMLQKGIQSPDDQTVMMTLFGAGLSGSLAAMEVLEKGLASPNPQMQLISLHFISKFNDDRITDVLNQAMSSDFLGIRMEAAFYMAEKKHPHAVGMIEGLMYRLPPAFKPLFPSLFASLGTTDATKTLRRLIEDPDSQTRVESILHVARLKRDDFLPMLRKRLTHSHIAEVEASSFAVGDLKDLQSVKKLTRLANSFTDTIRLSASFALFKLGDRSFVPNIVELAQHANLFAISTLGLISETDATLIDLLNSKDLQVRINAAISLLHKRDPSCLKGLKEILIQDARNLAFHPFQSVGRTMTAFKAVPGSLLRLKDETVNLSYSFVIREQFLKEAFHLPEETFFSLVEEIFRAQQNDLVPTSIALLENLQTEKAIALLKKSSEKTGAPLIRDYCRLALFRLGVDGPYEELVRDWVMNQKESKLIEFRELPPWSYRLDQPDYTLTPEETSRLLIESFLSIASKRDQESISFLLDAIQKGNEQNRYALMGLLMKATE